MRLLARLCRLLFVVMLPLLSSPLAPTASASNFTVNSLDDATAAIRRIYRAEMIRAFLRSAEYRGRFGGDPSRGNP